MGCGNPKANRGGDEITPLGIVQGHAYSILDVRLSHSLVISLSYSLTL